MQINRTETLITTPSGEMPAVLFTPVQEQTTPAILLLMEAFGVTSHIQQVATRVAQAGYVVLVPDLYYRELPHNKFRYDEVDQAMAMMWRLDFGNPIAEDIRAALKHLKSQSTVNPERIGVTGFCLGGGLTFLTACKFSPEIAAAAPFYGMVIDEWIEAAKEITVPVYLFFGGQDPFISRDRIQQIDDRFQELGKDYTLDIYPDAGHGFFCDERSDYNRSAAENAWQKLIQFFRQYLSTTNAP